MTKRPHGPPGIRGGPLSEEDQALWERTAQTLRPLQRRGSHLGPAADARSEHRRAETPAQPATKVMRPRAGVSAGPEPRPATKSSVPAPGGSDPKAVRRLKQGRIAIERRIDLHGMRQSEAHAALKRFLTGCHARGERWVLVITGKGAPSRGGWDDVAPDFLGADERGVLKRNVPRWLAEPELSAIVVGFAAAAAQHGGEGALYVQLRRPERAKP